MAQTLRDISIILETYEICHGVAIVKDDCNNNDNNKSHNGKAIEAYELYDKGNGPVQIAIQLGPFRKASNPVLRRVPEGKMRIQVMIRLQGIKGIKGQPFVASETADC